VFGLNRSWFSRFQIYEERNIRIAYHLAKSQKLIGVTVFFIIPNTTPSIRWDYLVDLLIIAIFIFVSMLVVSGDWKWTMKKIEKIKITERIKWAKTPSIICMMNPHFIFNSLNSVQYLINCQRNEEANDYIAMMAKLIRKNLDTGGKHLFLWRNNRLKLYLDIEKLYFKENFLMNYHRSRWIRNNDTIWSYNRFL